MSGRTTLTPAGTLFEIALWFMDGATGEGVSGIDPTDAGFSVRYRRQGQTSDTPMALAAVSADAAIAANQWREYGDGLYTVVGPAAMYASGARFVKVAGDCGTPAALADVVIVSLAASDTLAAAVSETTIANAVDAAVADNFAAIPAATSAQLLADLAGAAGTAVRGAFATAVRTLLLKVRHGVQSTPSGGSSQPLIVADASVTPAVVLGTAIVQRDSNGRIVGTSEVV